MAEPVSPLLPPLAARRPAVLEAHGDRRIDPYFWLRQRANPEVIAYLDDENAYADDFSGKELHELRFRDLGTGEDLDDVIESVYYGGAWSADCKTFFYVRPDSTMRPYQVWRHVLGTPEEDDALVLQEDDEGFELNVELTKSEKFVILSSTSQITSECRYLRADKPHAKPVVIEPRRPGVEYSVDHQGDRFVILTNDGARNFRLVAAPFDAPGRDSWTEIVAERRGVRLNATDVHVNHVVLGQRSDGLQRLEVLDCRTGQLHVVEQPDQAYTAFAGSSPDYDTAVMRFFYTSLTAPWTALDYNMDTRERTVVKVQPVGGDYNRDDYVTDRVWATSHDGVKVPMSIVHRRGVPRDGSNPALLYGYGAYEMPSDPMFDAARLSLLDRGFVYAIAHVRGGGEMGREWYEDGKFLNKANTFKDFIACARELIAKGYTSPEHLAIRGRSAGGLLIGAVMNEAPELFACAVAQVPFVDALTTMLDSSLPLTVNEYEEWGDPNDVEFYEYIKTYSPYDNIRPANYPALLATGALN